MLQQKGDPPAKGGKGQFSFDRGGLIMRFNNPDEVKAAAHKSARELVRRHLEHGHDLNPYCTPGARGEFDRAFSNMPRRSFDTDPAWDYRYQLGRAVAEILRG
jgi:hypothetical protein